MFQERLKLLREEFGMMQKEVAERIGVSERVYSFYETGRFPKNEVILKNLAECFNCTTDYLLGVNEFRNYEEIKQIRENTEVFKQIENPQFLESTKGVFNTLADIGKNLKENSYAVSHCLDNIVDSVHEMLSYSPSAAELDLPSLSPQIRETLNNMKLLEFNAFSTEKINAMNESIKTMASEIANKIKANNDNYINGEIE